MVIFSPSHFSFSLSFFSRRGGGGSISVVYARVKARFRVIKIEEFDNRNAIIPLLINIYIYIFFFVLRFESIDRSLSRLA